jgi:hypothetical protein
VSDKYNQQKKVVFTKLTEFFKGFEGTGCACNCLKKAWEKYAEEEAKKDNQGESESQEQ